MKTPSIAVLLMAHAFLYGCYLPSPVAQTPEVHGVVIDAATRGPVDGALAYYKEYPRNVSETDVNGRFKLSEIEKWEFVSIGAKSVPCTSGTLVLEDPKYQKKELEIRGKGGWPVEMTFELTRSK